MAIKLGNFEVRDFGLVDATFGAHAKDYPKYSDIPEKHSIYGRQSDEMEIAAKLFYEGGHPLEGRKMREGYEITEYITALRAFLCSFDVKHEVKMGTCAWLIETCTEKE